MLNGENLKNDIIGSFDDLMKARRASVGEIRVWSDEKKYIKTLKGWIPTEKASSYSKKDVIWHENKFGENYSEYAGKPKEALDFLIDKKSGQVRNAWERDDIGDIDIVYGKKAFGLKHIIGKHVGITEDGKEKDFKDEKELTSTVDKLLREGKLIKDYVDENGFRKRILSLGKHALVITQTIVVDNEDNFKEKRWIVTSYDPTRTMKEKGIKKAISEEIALEKEVIDSHSLSIQRKKDAPLVAYSSPSFSLPKDTTNTNDMQQFMDEIIEKSKKGAPIGTERTYSNGKTYVKTENGWKPKSGAKKTKKEDDQTEKTSSKVNDVNSYASKASDEQLQAAINDKDASPEIKQAAQEELSKRNPKKEDDGSDKIIDTLQKLLDAQKKGELKLGEEMLNQIKEKLKTLKQKKSESVTEETLNKKLDKLKEDISSKIDEKLDKLNGFKKITQTYVKVDGQTIVLNMKGEDRYKAKKGKFYMESEPKESLVEFKKRVKEAFENKLKESEKEGVQKQEKVEEKINKPVKKMQVFNSAGQLFFGNTTQALEGGSDVEFTKDNVTFRLSSIDKGNDTIYTLKNQDTGEEISWENSLIRLKSKINELTKDDSSKSTTLHFENVEELEDYVSKRNSAKGNLTEDQLDRFNKVFKELEQNINSIEERNLGFIRNNIKDSNYRYLLDVYAKVNPSMKMAMNKELIKSGCLPIANGMLYSEYNGKDYRHFTEENESKLFYKADRNRTNETEKKALDFYKGEGYVGIREFNLGKSENSQFSQMSSIISSFIDKNPLEDNLVLNRRMDVNTISDINALNQWIGANVGDVIEDKSFTSFSLRQFANFGDDLQVTLLAKKGDKISNINNPYETEYLAQKNSKYKVIAKGTNSIVVEIV